MMVFLYSYNQYNMHNCKNFYSKSEIKQPTISDEVIFNCYLTYIPDGRNQNRLWRIKINILNVPININSNFGHYES